MATITPEEIAKMKEELRKDLEALERVEKLISGRNGTQPAKQDIPSRDLLAQHLRPLSELPPPEQLGLKQLCILGLKTAGDVGAAPKDLVVFCKQKGYRFSSDANGSASITTALSRLIVDGKVVREDGRYYWVGGEED